MPILIAFHATPVPSTTTSRSNRTSHAGTFAGDATIRVRITEPSTEIVCNALELVVEEAWFDHGGDASPLDIEHDAGTERVRVPGAESARRRHGLAAPALPR